MTADLPDYYFRIRDNGAVVFKLDTENRQRRWDMEEIAVVNVKNGSIKPHGDRAMHDLRTVLVRKRSENLRRQMEAGAEQTKEA